MNKLISYITFAIIGCGLMGMTTGYLLGYTHAHTTHQEICDDQD